MKLTGVTFYQLLYEASVKRYKAINSDRSAPRHAHPGFLVSKHYLSKALKYLACAGNEVARLNHAVSSSLTKWRLERMVRAAVFLEIKGGKVRRYFFMH